MEIKKSIYLNAPVFISRLDGAIPVRHIEVEGRGKFTDDMKSSLCGDCLFKLDNLMGACFMGETKGGQFQGGFHTEFKCYMHLVYWKKMCKGEL